MNNKKLTRVSPSMFDENPVMIGRNKSDLIWKKFNWGDKNDLIWEYCPLTHLNKHLVGTTDDYSEVDETKKEYDNDVIVNETKDDIEKVVEIVNGLSDKQIGICAMYSLYKYSALVQKKEFVLADNYRNFVISIMTNDEFKKFNEISMKMKDMGEQIRKNQNNGEEV